MTKAFELDTDPKAKNDTERSLNDIKSRLELEQRIAVQCTAHPEEIEENKKSFSVRFNNFKETKEKPKTPRKKKYSPDHDCRNSNYCKKEWKALGCSELYKFPTVDERHEFLKERNLCIKCEIFITQAQPRHFCKWKEKHSVKCTKKPCHFGAATCKDHQGGNAGKDLKDWLTDKGIGTTVTSIFSFPCRARKSATPLDTNVSGKERSKLQLGQLASDFTDEQIKELFEKDLQNEQIASVDVRPIPEGEVAFIFCKMVKTMTSKPLLTMAVTVLLSVMESHRKNLLPAY